MLRRFLTARPVLSIGILLVLCAVVFYVVENWRGRRAWESWRAAAEKRGVKLFLTDFIPAEIPDAENFAAIPLIRELFAKSPSGESAPNPFKLPLNFQDSTPRPKFQNDIEDRRFDAAAWQDFFLKTKLLTEKTDSTAADILRALERYAPAMQQIRDAALRPRCRFPTRWADGRTTGLDRLTCLQSLSTHLTLRMNASLALGRSADALAEFRLGIRVHDALASEPCLIAALVRISILAQMESAVWGGLDAGQWRDADLATIENLLATLHLGDDCRFAFATERGFWNTALLKLLAGGSSSEIYETFEGLSGTCNTFPYHDWTVIHFYPRGWLYLMLIRNNEYFDWLLSRCDALCDALPAGSLLAYQDSNAWFAARPTHPGVEELESMFEMGSQSVFDSTFRKNLFIHTRTQETRLACALERFRHAKSAFPKQLEELVPDFVPVLPADLFDGQPLRYRLNPDGGYDLWSIGPDRKDGGGMRAPKDVRDEADDWIWHMPGRKVSE